MFVVLASLRVAIAIMFIRKERLKTIRRSKSLLKKFKVYRILSRDLIRKKKVFRIRSNRLFTRPLNRSGSPKMRF
jgi:hypothetical protein